MPDSQRSQCRSRNHDRLGRQKVSRPYCVSTFSRALEIEIYDKKRSIEGCVKHQHPVTEVDIQIAVAQCDIHTFGQTIGTARNQFPLRFRPGIETTNVGKTSNKDIVVDVIGSAQAEDRVGPDF